MAKREKKQNLMDVLVGELAAAQAREDEETLLDLCISGSRRKIAAVPLRYRLIALGFVKRLPPDEVNRRLTENGCAKLYARSYREAALLYSLGRGDSYEEWKTLEKDCRQLRDELGEEIYRETAGKMQENPLAGSTFSLKGIRQYVADNSLQEQSIAMTRHKTRSMEKKLADMSQDLAEFRHFLLINLNAFSTVREKTRYYFCKYLQYFLESRMKAYLRFIERYNKKGNAISADYALEGLGVFRIITKLRRKKYPPDKAREMIEESALSLGEIYDAFNYFYFGYVSENWMQVLMESFGGPEDIPPAPKKKIAAALRRYNRSMAGLSDDEVIRRQVSEMERAEEEEEEKYARDGSPSYQAGRAGENYLRKILRGTLDLDRTTFLAFLLFFGKNADIPQPHRISRGRLDGILEECGFSTLDEELPFDSFVCRFLTAEDPAFFVIEEAGSLALSAENFYLFKTYLSSRSYESDWEVLV